MFRGLLRSLALLVCAAALPVGRPSPARAQGLDLRVRQGYDTNVFEAATDVDSLRVDAHYSQLRFSYEYETPGRPLRFFAHPEARVKFFPQSSSGNEYLGELSLGLENDWRNPNSDARWLRRANTRLRAFAGYERALFIKHQTREEFENREEVDTSLPIDALPDLVWLRGDLRVRSELTEAVILEGGVLVQVENYSDGAPIMPRSFDRRDNREWGAYVSSGVELGRSWEVSGRVRWLSRMYPNREARTADGESVDGTTRRYVYWDFETEVEFERGAFENKLELTYRRRSDVFAGYRSYHRWEVGDEAAFGLGRRVDLELRYSFGQKSYDIWAAAPGTEPILNDYHEAGVALSARVSTALVFVLGSEYERTRSNDPFLDFERMDLFGEFRLAR